MKYSLRCDQTREYIDKADELYVPWKRKDIVEEIHTQYPGKFILLDVSEILYPTEEDKNEIKMLAGLCRGQLKLLVGFDYYKDLKLVSRILNYPMHSLYEMEIARSNGITEFYLGTELIHQMDKVENYKRRNKVTIRVKANDIAFNDGVKVEDENILALGGYILPEEVDLIDDTVDILDFQADEARQEAAFYRIYAEEKYWGGEINLLFQEFSSKALVRMMQPYAPRFKCNQSCLGAGLCRFCLRNLTLANPELYKNIIDKPQDADAAKED